MVDRRDRDRPPFDARAEALKLLETTRAKAGGRKRRPPLTRDANDVARADLRAIEERSPEVAAAMRALITSVYAALSNPAPVGGEPAPDAAEVWAELRAKPPRSRSNR